MKIQFFFFAKSREGRIHMEPTMVFRSKRADTGPMEHAGIVHTTDVIRSGKLRQVLRLLALRGRREFHLWRRSDHDAVLVETAWTSGFC